MPSMCLSVPDWIITENYLTQDIKCNIFFSISNGIYFYMHHLPNRCKTQIYPKIHLNASIVVCFYNEEPHTLYRTVYSVLDRTPEELLHEILLVDDSSDAGLTKYFQFMLTKYNWLLILDQLHQEIEKFVFKNFPSKVQLVKTPKREGLIRARIFGAKKATGQVIQT